MSLLLHKTKFMITNNHFSAIITDKSKILQQSIGKEIILLIIHSSYHKNGFLHTFVVILRFLAPQK